MKTENKNYDNEATQYEEPKAESNASVKTEDKNGKKSFIAKSAAGLGLGVVLGTASSFATTKAVISEDDTDDEDINSTNPTDSSNNPVEIVSMNDELSFSQAFSAARAEVGPGGAFVWRGNIYSTFTQEEWASMSEEERSDYHSRIDWSEAGSSSVSNETDANNENNNDSDRVNGGENAAENSNNNENGEEVEVVVVNPDNPVEAPVDYDEVEVLGVYHDPETGADFVNVLYGDQDVRLADFNDDGIVDLVGYDMNGDGNLTPDEVIDASDQHISMGDLTGQSLYAVIDGPDFQNTAGDIDYSDGYAQA